VSAGTVDGSGAIGFLLQPLLVGENLAYIHCIECGWTTQPVWKIPALFKNPTPDIAFRAVTLFTGIPVRSEQL